MNTSRVKKGLSQIRLLAINIRFIRSAMERENRLMFETAEKSSIQKINMFTVSVKTPIMI